MRRVVDVALPVYVYSSIMAWLYVLSMYIPVDLIVSKGKISLFSFKEIRLCPFRFLKLLM